MSALYVSVLNAFKNAGWAYREVQGHEVIETQFEAYHTKVPLHLQTFENINALAVVATAGITVARSHRQRAAELLMRANKELNLGNFEMDWDNGMVMFRQSQVFGAFRHDEKIIAGMVHNAVAEMDRLTPCLGILCKTNANMLPMLDVAGLLQREDLLPPPPLETE